MLLRGKRSVALVGIVLGLDHVLEDGRWNCAGIVYICIGALDIPEGVRECAPRKWCRLLWIIGEPRPPRNSLLLDTPHNNAHLHIFEKNEHRLLLYAL